MDWFKRAKEGLKPQKKRDMPSLWMKCEVCEEIIYKKELERNFYVCSTCQRHFRIQSSEYIKILLDDEKFEEFNANITSVDFLKFRANKKYADQIKEATKKTGMNEAIRTGFGKIYGHDIVLCIMDFSFIGGSMGSVVGEKVARAIDESLKRRIPLIIISASGGARMMEGALSLMQLAKTSSRLARLSEAGVLYVSILTDPTTGGVTASYAMLGDVILAEPGALIGFAGPRVIKQTIGQDLPEGFQRAEFQLKHGFADAVVSRHEMKEKLKLIFDFATDGPFNKDSTNGELEQHTEQSEQPKPFTVVEDFEKLPSEN
ncbi:acetyl-CoA carboxylase carboxyltransferase subunit beta [candidate division KSB1 bacterium]|nr:acetyl-CoA carboxylase carboxyltransferase subunit beta [candidate division KSB1 bacterium]NIR70685.1 acetyl-CoA carboxylase carboxyltransferase subunit beta [candidate division KSB1 bacterium]NIS26037.1 acetyl-CoA carboxylase carboxyltransferase subunit beta [candidate division KSB1 bacterium]NIT72861.1 acetyl-CoA carboxylase carboxyltransferase subunit beta [candidate division KSB1 bacterium]NIU26702.1 acetyl-CoA carboxylase carboxyltransferase subunit beta [candidate division KSB1 bacteri